MKWNRALPLLCVILAVGWTGCAEDETDTFGDWPLRVRVGEWETGEPVAGVKIVVMDPAANRPLAGPLVTDAAGTVNFGPVRGPSAGLLVFGGADYEARNPLDWSDLYILPAGKSITAPAPGPVPVRVARRREPGGPPSLAGTVVDADTGAPLDRVFVGLSSYARGYAGDVRASDDVTGADGAFLVLDVPLAQSDPGGPITQLAPLRVTREGYRPTAYAYSARFGDPNPEITGIVIPMQRIGEGDTGVLSGRVLRDGAPLAGVPVAIGFIPTMKGAAGVPGVTAVTAEDGSWSVSGLAPGAYVADPGYLPGDGSFFPSQAAARPYEVFADTETVTDDLVVVHEILPWHGRGTYAEGLDAITLSWSEVPGADYYAVNLGGEILGPFPEASHALPAADLPPGSYPWRVQAYDAGDIPIGISEMYVWFVIR